MSRGGIHFVFQSALVVLADARQKSLGTDGIVNNPQNWAEDNYLFYNPQHRPDLQNGNFPTPQSEEMKCCC